MSRSPYRVRNAFTLAVALLCGCQAGEPSPRQEARDQKPAIQPDRDQKPATIVVRSVLPPDLKEKSVGVLRYGLTQADLNRLGCVEELTDHVPLRMWPQEMQHLEKKVNVRLVATTEGYGRFNRLEMAAGRFLEDERDSKNLDNVIVLSAGVANELFPDKDPVGKTVVLNKFTYKVVGTIKERQPQKTASHVEEYDRDVYIPLATSRVRFGKTILIREGEKRTAEEVELHQILIKVADPARLEPVEEVIRQLLRKHHARQDWEVTVR